MIQGNPTGSGQSHFYLKPNLRLGDQQARRFACVPLGRARRTRTAA
jgi:hypothetical protein